MALEFKTATVAELEKLYNDFIVPYFPEAEVKPCSSINRMMNDGLYQIIVGCDEKGAAAVAFITTAPGARFYLLDYLAVRDDCRSKGYGGEMLKYLPGVMNSQPIIIETEAIDAAKNETERVQRINRNAFYRRNGVVESELRTCIFGVTYTNWELSANEVKLKEGELAQELKAIYSYMVREDLYKDNVKIPAIN